MLVFEEVKSNLGDTLWRAPIPGGWLVKVTSEVIHQNPQQGMQSGWDWRSSITFVPDKAHSWKVEV